MKFAVLADSHDNLPALSYWVEYYNTTEADILLHAGDIISPFMLSPLTEFDGPVHVVFGNNDGDRSTWKEMADDTNVNLYEAPVTLEFSDLTIGMSHKPEDLPDAGTLKVDLLIHGHTHERKWNEDRDLPVANPGEAGGWISDTSSSLLVTAEKGEIDHEFTLVPAP